MEITLRKAETITAREHTRHVYDDQDDVPWPCFRRKILPPFLGRRGRLSLQMGMTRRRAHVQWSVTQDTFLRSTPLSKPISSYSPRTRKLCLRGSCTLTRHAPRTPQDPTTHGRRGEYHNLEVDEAENGMLLVERRGPKAVLGGWTTTVHNARRHYGIDGQNEKARVIFKYFRNVRHIGM